MRSFLPALSLLPTLAVAHLEGPLHARHPEGAKAAAAQQQQAEREISDADLALAHVPVLDERQSVGVGGANVSTGNITAGVGDISLDVGNITIQTGNLTLEDIVLGNIVVIVDVGVGSPVNASNSTNSTGGGGDGNTGGQATTIITNGEEEVEIVTVRTEPSTFYTFSDEPYTTTFVELSSTHIELDEGDVVSATPTIRDRALITPAPDADLAKRQVSISPTVSVGPVSASVGEIGATVGNINVTVGDVLVGLGDITLKNITIGNVFVSVNIQANLKRSDAGADPTNGVLARALPEPRATKAPEPRADQVEKRILDGIHVDGRREIRA